MAWAVAQRAAQKMAARRWESAERAGDRRWEIGDRGRREGADAGGIERRDSTGRGWDPDGKGRDTDDTEVIPPGARGRAAGWEWDGVEIMGKWG